MESPFVIVDLDHAPEDLALAQETEPRDRDRVLIGLAADPRETVEGFDILLTGVPDPPKPWVGCADPHATARQLSDLVESRPAASVALVQVLRMGDGLSIPDRLVLESLAYSTLQGGADFRSWLAAAPRRTHRPAETPVRLGRDGPRLSITLDRPWVRNAFDAATRDALCEALQVALADPSIGRVDLCGNGPAFCSGGDLAEFGTSRDPARAHLVRVHRSPGALLHRCARRVTAYLHGACVGAGIELAAFAGRVVAASDTVIRLPEIGMGLIPGAGGTASIPVRVGRERTAYLALSGLELSVEEALRWGLVDEISDLDDAAADSRRAFQH
ncbi:enoyl-CoA hydratase/isomerase family protein [Streptomyces sp. NBC_01261]|uniref:enoyl-CoA hydratase/isomerase family protein n=1 Tax=Streptomyces sp. NBC_01261 TaxID=2903802 RepID=UPI002E33D693|nr:enoyl-CoA hydratase/isomerase family protein [Streptomyces sp. NBC_01261]